jgi:caa(3)-type oxidase subunit IV
VAGDATTIDHDEVFDPHAPADHAHPTDRSYAVVAAVLAGLTAIEVGLYYTDLEPKFFIPILMVLMVAKFAGVVWYFMHLKYDSRTFRRLFLSGLLLALGVYLIVLFTFQFFD